MNEKIRTYTAPDQEDARAKMRALAEGYEGDAEISTIISEVREHDKAFGTLQAIHDRHLRKSNVSEGRLLTDLEIIQFSDTQWKETNMSAEAIMATDVRIGSIFVHDTALRKMGEDHNDLEMTVLHCLVHEIGHAISDVQAHVTQTSVGVAERITTGLRQNIHLRIPVVSINHTGIIFSEQILATQLYELLNEAVNDVLAEDIVKEYAPAIGFASESRINTFYASFLSPGSRYGQARRLLKALTRKISTETGTEESAVGNAFRRGLLEGIDLVAISDIDSSPVLDEVTRRGFSLELADIESPKQLKTFIAKYKLETFFERLTARFKEYLDRS